MKKMFAVLFLICFVSTNMAFAVTTYDKWGTKTGSYKRTSSGYDSYDKWGTKTGSYKKTSSGYDSYDKWGTKTGSYKLDQSDRAAQYDNWRSIYK